MVPGLDPAVVGIGGGVEWRAAVAVKVLIQNTGPRQPGSADCPSGPANSRWPWRGSGLRPPRGSPSNRLRTAPESVLRSSGHPVQR